MLKATIEVDSTLNVFDFALMRSQAFVQPTFAIVAAERSEVFFVAAVRTVLVWILTCLAEMGTGL